MITCGERDWQEGRDSSVRFAFGVLTKVSMGGVRLNAEHGPDKCKRRDQRSILGSYYDETGPNDGNRCRGLDEHRDDTRIHR
jgi:hypothetical protein